MPVIGEYEDYGQSRVKVESSFFDITVRAVQSIPCLTSPGLQFPRQGEGHRSASGGCLEQESIYDSCVAHDKKKVDLRVVVLNCFS
jgi:hypothetical protein